MILRGSVREHRVSRPALKGEGPDGVACGLVGFGGARVRRCTRADARCSGGVVANPVSVPATGMVAAQFAEPGAAFLLDEVWQIGADPWE